MMNHFEIYGTRIPFSSIKDFRIINVEFIYRPVYGEAKKSIANTFSGKKFEFIAMEPYAAIIGQQGQKSELGEYKAKTFKEALGKDLSGAVIYTIADKLKIKAIKQQKYQCLNLAGRAFSAYLDDIPVKLEWSDGRVAEVFKEDSLYAALPGSTTPGIQYIPALVIKADETFCFYGNEIQVFDALFEYERLKSELELYGQNKKGQKRLGGKEKFSLPQVPKFRLPTNSPKGTNATVIELPTSDEE